MITIVVLNINGHIQLVECEGIARDGLLKGNIVLTNCKELDTEDKDGQPLDTKIWSVHESLVVSYAMGRRHEPKVEPKVEPAAVTAYSVPNPPIVDEPPAIVVTPEMRERSIRIDKEARARRNAEQARRAAAAKEAAVKEAVEEAIPPRRTRRKKDLKEV